MSKIAIAGDFAPTKNNELEIINGSAEAVFGNELAGYIRDCTFVGINLETSLADHESPKLKRGQINRARTATATFLSRAGIDLCFLANNHVIDSGNTGVESTINALEQNGVKHIGAGKTDAEAKRCFFIELDGKKIGLYNVANYEFNKITASEYGANTYDPLVTFDEIDEVAKHCDYLIVVYHGGLEYYRYPTPELQRICRKMVEKGAKLVTCQHSHCIGTYEEYNGATIVYGQGNFLFDDSEKEEEKTAIILEVDAGEEKIKFVPVMKDGYMVRMASDEEKDRILKSIELRHEEISVPGAVENMFKHYCLTHQHEPLRALTGYNKWYRALSKLTGGRFQDHIFNKKNRMRIYNMLETPVHLEVLQGVMKQYEDKK